MASSRRGKNGFLKKAGIYPSLTTTYNSAQPVRLRAHPKFFAMVALRAYYTNAKNFGYARTLGVISRALQIKKL